MSGITDAREYISNVIAALDSSLEQTMNDRADELRIARRLIDEGVASISPPPPTLPARMFLPNADELCELFKYDAYDGGLIYRGGPKEGFKPASKRGNYNIVSLRCSDGRHTSTAVTRVLWCMLAGEWPDGLDVAHENDLSLDDRIHNIVAVPHWVNLMMGGTARGDTARGVVRRGDRYLVMGPSVGTTHPFAEYFDTEEEAVAYRFSLFYQELNRRKAARDALIPAFMKRNGW